MEVCKGRKYSVSYICIKVTFCTYVPFSRPNRWTNIHQILHTDLPINSGKVLNTSMTPQTLPLDSGVSQTPKPKWVTGEKTLLYKKCPDGRRKLINLVTSRTFPNPLEGSFHPFAKSASMAHEVLYWSLHQYFLWSTFWSQWGIFGCRDILCVASSVWWWRVSESPIGSQCLSFFWCAIFWLEL